MPELDPKIREYYERGHEASRLLRTEFPSGPLELVRTQEIILRYLPSQTLDIVDVGGGAGVHAIWLAERGHQVHLVDPVPLHIEQARSASSKITAEVGDARELSQSDNSYDVVLLLGPLYHLTELHERKRALAEARRVLRPGGLVFAAAISRYAGLFDLLVRLDLFHEPGVQELVEGCLRTGVHAGVAPRLFTTAYFHLPEELAGEVSGQFEDTEIFNLEGPGFLVADFEKRWKDPIRREAILKAARLVERDPNLLAASSHLLAVARKPGNGGTVAVERL
jgi:ubiquinone/menaquinone biosynthesis C-methylase UbiE